ERADRSSAAHRQAGRQQPARAGRGSRRAQAWSNPQETEGVFLMRNGHAEFIPIKMGIAGDKYFEVLSGLEVSDQVITGPYNSVRGLKDGDLVRLDNKQVK